MKQIDTTYIGRADVTVDTIQLANGKIAYLYNKDGETSLLPNLDSLFKFLEGDTSVRMGCFNTEDAEEIIEGFELIFN